ncbi:MAG TPA: hypothetical protein VFB23_08865 [Candidatus Acidoferrales bacterium]|nr:hypothetical protein [Candidatus Acidoferrales bacterium]
MIENRKGRPYSTLLEQFFLSTEEAREAEVTHAIAVRNAEQSAGRSGTLAEANLFVSLHPEFLPCPTNAGLMENRFRERGITEPNLKQLETVWSEIVESGEAVFRDGPPKRLSDKELESMSTSELEQRTREFFLVEDLRRRARE